MTIPYMGDAPYLLPLDKLVQLVGNPFDSVVWDCPQFTKEDVLSCAADALCEDPYDIDVQDWVSGQDTYHIGRIAYLLRHGWNATDEDEYTPRVYVAPARSMTRSSVVDGNHRLAAAILRGDKFYFAYLDGDYARAAAIFGI